MNTPQCLILFPTPVLQSVEWQLNYNFGDVRDWMATAADPTSLPLHMCSSRIMSGKFESGARVTGALLNQTVAWFNVTGSPVKPPFDPSAPHPELGLLVLHDGDVVPPTETTVVCGSPRVKRGLVFDSWRLVQPWEMPPGGSK